MENKKTIIRVQHNKDHPYIMLDKACINNINISWKAKGLHTYLISLPDNWKIYVSELIKHSKDGRESTTSAIKELMEFGYITRTKIRNKLGQFMGYEYIVYEVPQESIISYNNDVNLCSPENGKSEIGYSNNGKLATTNKELDLEITKLNNKTTTTNQADVVASIPIDLSPEQETQDKNKASEYKVKIDKVIGASISTIMVNKLLTECGEEKVNTYLLNWDKFKSSNKKNIVGFFVNAVQVGYDIPKQEIAITNSSASNMHNFDQREYSADYFEQFYYKVG